MPKVGQECDHAAQDLSDKDWIAFMVQEIEGCAHQKNRLTWRSVPAGHVTGAEQRPPRKVIATSLGVGSVDEKEHLKGFGEATLSTKQRG